MKLKALAFTMKEKPAMEQFYWDTLIYWLLTLAALLK